MRGPRFDSKLSDDAAQLNASIDFDQRLLPFDVEGSKAHARMLAAQGILSAADAEAIARGLDQVVDEWRRGALTLDPQLEDVHMNVEHRLTELIGDAGARLHTARSRNDQVATDLRLYARTQAGELDKQIAALQRALVEQARAHIDTLMPGYTHLQRAQPVPAGAPPVGVRGDAGARSRAARGRGAADERVAARLGRAGGHDLPDRSRRDRQGARVRAATANSLDAVGDRDFAVELAAACALVMAHLSRLGEELVLWASQEFGFARLPEAYCSGSSIMPQKVNPDIPELVRAKAGRVIGDLTTLLVVIKGLPLAYNKDLQETQEPLYDAVETAISCARTMAGLIAESEFDRERMQRAVGAGTPPGDGGRRLAGRARGAVSAGARGRGRARAHGERARRRARRALARGLARDRARRYLGREPVRRARRGAGGRSARRRRRTGARARAASDRAGGTRARPHSE